MRETYNTIILCKKIISFCSELFSIRTPELYFIYEKRNNYKLMNSDLQVISYDSRSLDVEVECIYFDYKMYQMYINMDILNDGMSGIIVVLRKMRELYHLCQIQKLRKHQKIQEDRVVIQQWRHAYEVRNQKRCKPESITELDKNAFAKYIFYHLFDIDLKFKVLSLESFRKHLYQIELNYDSILIQELAKKHRIKVKVARYVCLDNFQVELLTG